VTYNKKTALLKLNMKMFYKNI